MKILLSSHYCLLLSMGLLPANALSSPATTTTPGDATPSDAADDDCGCRASGVFTAAAAAARVRRLSNSFLAAKITTMSTAAPPRPSPRPSPRSRRVLAPLESEDGPGDANVRVHAGSPGAATMAMLLNDVAPMSSPVEARKDAWKAFVRFVSTS